jgi:hypothetical protein
MLRRMATIAVNKRVLVVEAERHQKFRKAVSCK